MDKLPYAPKPPALGSVCDCEVWCEACIEAGLWQEWAAEFGDE